MDLSFAVTESAGDTKPVPRWLSSPVSEAAFEGTIELAVVLAPESTSFPSFVTPDRRMIFIVGWVEEGISEEFEDFARTLKGVGLYTLVNIYHMSRSD